MEAHHFALQPKHVRILILHSRYLSGPASGENAVVQDEVRLLSEAGHQVKVWEPSADSLRGFGLVKSGIQAVWSREAVDHISRMVREMRADIVHCHNLFPTLSPAVIRAAWTQGAAPVMTLHNYRLMCLPSTFLRDGEICEDCLGRTPWPGVVHRCYRDSLPGSTVLAVSLSLHRALGTFDRVALFLCVSEFVRRKYAQAGIPMERLTVKSNFAWPTARRHGSGDYFLFVGRISSEKGLHTLLDAWRRTPARLLVVGDGPEADLLRHIAPPNVEFVGMVPNEDVADFLLGARGLLMPSRSYEAQPRVILEAYAAGVPVIASRIGGIPDLVQEDTSGYLVEPDDVAGWTDAAERLLDDRLVRRLGDGAYRLWNDRYSPRRALDALEDSYRRALS
jgi:glycosyltransferase involved in cell wall biosynthesis